MWTLTFFLLLLTLWTTSVNVVTAHSSSSAYHLRSLTIDIELDDGDEDDHECGTRHPSRAEQEAFHNLTDAWAHDNRSRNLEAETIPVKLHVVIFTRTTFEPYGDLTDEYVEEHFRDTLNHAFQDAPFEFTLTSTTRVENDEYFKCRDELDFMTSYKQGGPEELTVYICNTFADGRFGVYGLTYYPSIVENDPIYDGILLMNPTLSKQGVSDMMIENMLVHEAGHWLGLVSSCWL